jgi:hypothetical protein
LSSSEQNVRTHVTFVTKLFNTEEVKDYFVNPRCFGDDCAQWLINSLVSQSVERIDEQPTQEDWGWRFSMTTRRRGFMIGVGLYEDEEAPNTWLAFIKPQPVSLSRKLFGQSDDAELLAICDAIDRALESAPEIGDVRWHTEEDWMKGENGNWRSAPNEV